MRAFFFYLLFLASGTLAFPKTDAAGYQALAARVAAINEALRTDEVCTHECRTEPYCPTGWHDIVESVNRNSTQGYRTELEQCGEHYNATCTDHACDGSRMTEAIGELSALRDQGLLREALSLLPDTVARREGGLVHVFGCAGEVVANISVDAPR
jgi:hypothetical protein